MKNARFYLASIFILFGLLCFGCANGNNNESGTPAQNSPTDSSSTSTGTLTTGVTTSGTVSSSTVAISEDNDIAMIKVDDKSYYLFTDTTEGANASVSANTLSRAAATIKNGTWMYYEDDKILYSGTYKGDISELTKITDTTSEEALEDFELELTVTAVADEEGDLYPVSTETTEATFTIEIKPDSENAEDFVLEATIPDVIKEETKLLEEVVYTCVAPSYPNGNENVETEICEFQFKTDGSVVYTMSGETVTTGSYSENAAEDGKVLITVTATVAGDEWIGYKMYVTISDGRLLIEGTASPGIFTKSAATAAYSFRKIENQDEVDLTTTDTVSFYPDKTFYMFEQIESDVGHGEEHDFVFGGIVCIGKYTGDPTKDGQITLTPEKIADSNGQLKTCTEEQSAPINITISNGEMPLSKGSGEPDDYIRIYPTE